MSLNNDGGGGFIGGGDTIYGSSISQAGAGSGNQSNLMFPSTARNNASKNAILRSSLALPSDRERIPKQGPKGSGN